MLIEIVDVYVNIFEVWEELMMIKGKLNIKFIYIMYYIFY